MKFSTKLFYTGLLLSSILIVGCKNDFVQPPSPSGSPITEVASTDANLTLFTAALNKTGLASALGNNNSGYFTVFAPSDDALLAYFQARRSNPALTKQNVLDTINNLKPTSVSIPTITQLAAILNYHVLSSKVTSDQLTGNQVFNMSNSTRLSISKVGSDILLNANLSGITTVNGAKVINTDEGASNGVIHTIDKVLIAPSVATILATIGVTVSYSTTPATVTPGTTDNSYNILAAALKKSGVALNLLPNTSPLPDFTIFAPTDAAFISYLGAASEAAGITAINSMDPTVLGNLLNYHILTGRVLSSDLSNGQQVSTWLTDKTFTASISGNTITLVDNNTGKADPVITAANVLTNAGVLHQINKVLYPN